ncbi:TIGR03067 domain-containing protein [Telmatocola sphagniphila]|uniref:TIGR03067 domain-containing protein n=1 Tax=Telmatocola sphagniphila TaxID=1123043 RepID=A0A8E6B787_9BACT|nr:TIGR03067 domain-containing protein [Telmatocola sphagniphila]QVL32642.1 TIGR03067 domain-containing protein [Telmatocola sphagniphila]
MRTAMTFGTLVLCSLMGTASAQKADKFDPYLMIGDWKITEGTKMGEKSEEKALLGKIVISKDLIQIFGTDNSKAEHEMSYKLDTKTMPVTITLTGKEGPAKDTTTEGIVEVSSDTLKLCYAFPGEKKPSEFGSKKDSKNFYFILKKQKDKK